MSFLRGRQGGLGGCIFFYCNLIIVVGGLTFFHAPTYDSMQVYRAPEVRHSDVRTRETRVTVMTNVPSFFFHGISNLCTVDLCKLRLAFKMVCTTVLHGRPMPPPPPY